MNVASLELCKALYELSGWDSDELMAHGNSIHPGEITPAYDLGYLLRKLPAGDDISISFYNSEWRMAIGTSDGQYADTPEDAAAKLCIELFKQNILSRSNSI